MKLKKFFFVFGAEMSRLCATIYVLPTERKSQMSYSPFIAKAQRLMLDAMKLESGCVSCGNVLPTVSATVLGIEIPATWYDFDHIDPSTKSHNVARMVGRYSSKSILAEVDKCQVLCKFCHALKTHK